MATRRTNVVEYIDSVPVMLTEADWYHIVAHTTRYKPTGGFYAFFVEGHPIPKARARIVTRVGKDGESRTHAFTPSSTLHWEDAVVFAFKAAYPGFDPLPAGTCVKVDILVVAGPVGKGVNEDASIRGDIDNFQKSLCDSLNGVAWHDDIQIVDGHTVKVRAGRGQRTGAFVSFRVVTRA